MKMYNKKNKYKIGLLAFFIILLYGVNKNINNIKVKNTEIMNEYNIFLTENYLNDINVRVPYFENVDSEFGKARLSVWKKNGLWAIVIEQIVYSYGNSVRNWTYCYGNASKRIKKTETFKNILSETSNTRLIDNEYDCDLVSLGDIKNYRGSFLDLPLNVVDYKSYFKYDIDVYPNIVNLEKIFYYLVDNYKIDMFSTKNEINDLFSSDLELIAMTDDWFYEPLGIVYWERMPSDIDFINQAVEILLGNRKNFYFEKTNSSWKDY